jgi:hypothetical protein
MNDDIFPADDKAMTDVTVLETAFGNSPKNPWSKEINS